MAHSVAQRPVPSGRQPGPLRLPDGAGGPAKTGGMVATVSPPAYRASVALSAAAVALVRFTRLDLPFRAGDGPTGAPREITGARA